MFQPFLTQFNSGASVRKTVSEYNVANNKSYKTIVSTGQCKRYACADSSCLFELEVYRKEFTKGIRSTQVSHIPSGNWYVTKFNHHSRSCIVTLNPSVKQLTSMSASMETVLCSNNVATNKNVIVKRIARTTTLKDTVTKKPPSPPKHNTFKNTNKFGIMFQPFLTQFNSGACVRKTVSEYNFAKNKSYKTIVSTGRCKRYACADSSCLFELEVYRKEFTKGIRSTQVSHIPSGNWYVTKFLHHSRSCTVTLNPSAKQLTSMSAFKEAVLSSNNVATNKTVKVKSSDGTKKRAEEKYTALSKTIPKVQRGDSGNRYGESSLIITVRRNRGRPPKNGVIKNYNISCSTDRFSAMKSNYNTVTNGFELTSKTTIPHKRGRPSKHLLLNYKKANNLPTIDTSYAHHHIEQFLQLSSLIESNTFSIEQKIQYVTDGNKLTMENIANGIISLKYPICITDVPESIGMKIDICAITSMGEQLRKKTIKNNRTLGTKLANTIRGIASVVGPSTEVTVINVKTQQEQIGWTFNDLVHYFDDNKRLDYVGNINSTAKKNTSVQILNQVSFEFSNTPLLNYVTAPTLVRELDWIRTAWPAQYQFPVHNQLINLTRQQRKNKRVMYYPLIQYYCVTSCGSAYMNFHIDLGGTSFWYYLLLGSKQFILIEPTNENLDQYEKWSCNSNKEAVFLPDLIRNKNTIFSVLLKEHETIIVPSGWIHAVYTCLDSLVFGGNFLHGYSTELQIKINSIEERALVVDKFLCPYFNITNVFAANMYFNKLQLIVTSGQNNNTISQIELDQLLHLLQYIILEDNNTPDSDLLPGNYCSVFDKPQFKDVIKYVCQANNCSTLMEFANIFVTAVQNVNTILNDFTDSLIECNDVSTEISVYDDYLRNNNNQYCPV